MRWSLFSEIFVMSWDTVLGNKLRSALTVLGIVIGITSIVGMTSLIRGFTQSFHDLIGGIGPDTIFVSKFSIVSFASGAKFDELMKRPNVTPGDAAAIERGAPDIEIVEITIGGGGPGGGHAERVYYGSERTKPLQVFGSTEKWPYAVRLEVESGRFFTPSEVDRRQNVIVLGQTAKEVLFPLTDPIGKTVRAGLQQYTVIGVMAKRPSPGGFALGQDDFVIVPYTTYAKVYGLRPNDPGRGEVLGMQIMAVPRAGVPRETAMAEVEQVMRIRHNLRLDEPDDFDMATQDAILKIFDQVTQGAFLALIVLSSIALMVGGIGVMSIMTISVTERTREIGVRKALGARRTEILWQFLLEAVFLTLAGGLLGIVVGSGIGLVVHALTGFPISLPWWAFAIGIGFSAGVGVFFGMVPAIRASRLDPIEALRYE
jgi:putative ABC transport system permease protein